jgi:hypothetical protein
MAAWVDAGRGLKSLRNRGPSSQTVRNLRLQRIEARLRWRRNMRSTKWSASEDEPRIGSRPLHHRPAPYRTTGIKCHHSPPQDAGSVSHLLKRHVESPPMVSRTLAH